MKMKTVELSEEEIDAIQAALWHFCEYLWKRGDENQYKKTLEAYQKLAYHL